MRVALGQRNLGVRNLERQLTQPNRETRLVRVKIRRAQFIHIFPHIFY
jgi:hypothetical protein